ncbi:MAG: histidine triad nucleotide-binding protein [Spirochaetaceae bacterium]|jgi:histidine triad (HIT) family protein|nr:histidine triad nucleotide-binding protein [Spirochaetaceae bacterium]
MEDTIFDKILRNEIPSEKVYEDDDVLAFKDINPKAPVHVLVIPKRKRQRFSEYRNVESDEAGIFMKKISSVAHSLGLDESGYRVIFNCGPHGGQEVEYIHAHILGGKKLIWSAG